MKSLAWFSIALTEVNILLNKFITKRFIGLTYDISYVL